MKNSLNRDIPDTARAFISSNDYHNFERVTVPLKRQTETTIFHDSLEKAFVDLGIRSGMTLSFHHHLRSGDLVLNQVARLIRKYDLRNINLAPSSIFPQYEILDLINEGRIHNIYTNYLNGPVADAIQAGKLTGGLIMQTHGGRARAIESGELPIDVAFLAAPTVDRLGNGSGATGKSACGTLGYAISDLMYADKVVLVTDNIVDKLDKYQFDHQFVDMVVKVDSIGDPKGIVSGTTRITRDPIGLKIANDTARLLEALGEIKPGMSIQTGAGGTSLAVADAIDKLMVKHNVKGSFASGGTTGFHVHMLKQGLFTELFDVQCFDLEAAQSYARNAFHKGISASEYANPYDPNAVVNKLDIVILGATEIDLDFNVNVTTDSFGRIIGGSGGHADTANGARLTIITAQLTRARIPVVREKVNTITTPGSDVDILVTERGIAINSRRQDLIVKAKASGFPVTSIESLLDLAEKICGKPKPVSLGNKTIGVVEYRDGSIIDSLYGLE